MIKGWIDKHKKKVGPFYTKSNFSFSFNTWIKIRDAKVNIDACCPLKRQKMFLMKKRAAQYMSA